MNISNKLTIARVVITAPFVFFGIYKYPEYRWVAFWLFVLAATTDFLDGRIARKYNEVTKFGIFMDPLADKILTSSGMIVLVDLHIIPSWMAILIIAREFTITGLRTLAMSSGKVISASKLGKAKTVSQIIAISALLVNFSGGKILIWVALVLTIVSGIEYFVRNREIFKDESHISA